MRRGYASLLAICFIGSCTLRDGYTQVTRVGPRLQPHEADCPLQTFPAGPPPYRHQDLGYARTTCGQFSRNACFIDLKRTACLQGADTIYGLNESVAEGNTYLTATLARALVDSGAAGP